MVALQKAQNKTNRKLAALARKKVKIIEQHQRAMRAAIAEKHRKLEKLERDRLAVIEEMGRVKLLVGAPSTDTNNQGSKSQVLRKLILTQKNIFTAPEIYEELSDKYPALARRTTKAFVVTYVWRICHQYHLTKLVERGSMFIPHRYRTLSLQERAFITKVPRFALPRKTPRRAPKPMQSRGHQVARPEGVEPSTSGFVIPRSDPVELRTHV